MGLGPADLARVASYKEKQLDYRGALDVYRRLHREHPRHPQGQRALVRGVVLCHGKVGDEAERQAWLEAAAADLAAGSWRDFLIREFALPAGRRAVPAPGRD